MMKISNFSVRILLIYPWKLVGALDRPNSMTCYLKWSYLVRNAVFHLSPSRILIQ